MVSGLIVGPRFFSHCFAPNSCSSAASSTPGTPSGGPMPYLRHVIRASMPPFRARKRRGFAEITSILRCRGAMSVNAMPRDKHSQAAVGAQWSCVYNSPEGSGHHVDKMSYPRLERFEHCVQYSWGEEGVVNSLYRKLPQSMGSLQLHLVEIGSCITRSDQSGRMLAQQSVSCAACIQH